MKKLLLSIFAVSSFSAGAQVTVFQDSFETYDDFLISGFGDWLTLDIDGLGTYVGGLPDEATPWPNAFDPQAWMVFNPTAAGVTNSTESCATSENRNFDPHTGSKYAGSWAGSPEGTVTRNEDWLISPVINLGASNNQVKFWVKQLSSCYGIESFKVGVISGTTTIDENTTSASFQVISGIPGNVSATVNWEEKTYNIPASFANSSVRVAILNRSADAYMLMVDDFSVLSSNMSTNDVLASKFSVYPNPANNVVNISSSDAIAVNQIQITDLNGRVVKQNQFDGVAQAQINVADLASGVYMMNITSAEGVAVKKIVRN
ncbi:T9SS type A sorting domain-containing protein [Flavobacterium sp. MAH-1]|uniref:T9SS type A sorting domain-containing protein n=1 Tax=Flavobacterium agri TaxID=2743471 RepID=A0A7Y8Y380_9FLAO|nr:T9SS type A sorting domain-containing protein [Flavobacterium agri]NUY81643.1 T9SS type A sorting domain-containing protein [Flavobacterium agri]NYA71667.1 T9SS type A sorting domain-containing protein [Flavobacterium agri]